MKVLPSSSFTPARRGRGAILLAVSASLTTTNVHAQDNAETVEFAYPREMWDLKQNNYYNTNIPADRPFEYSEGGSRDWVSKCMHTKGKNQGVSSKGTWWASFKDGVPKLLSTMTIYSRTGWSGGGPRLDKACIRLQREGEGEPSGDASDDTCDLTLGTVGVSPGIHQVTVNEVVLGFKIISADPDNYLGFCGITIRGSVPGIPMAYTSPTASGIDASQPSYWSGSINYGADAGKETQPLEYTGGSVSWPSKCSLTAGGSSKDTWTAKFAKPTFIQVMKLWNRNTARNRLDFASVYLDGDMSTVFQELDGVWSAGGMAGGTGVFIGKKVSSITLKTKSSDGVISICGAQFFTSVPTIDVESMRKGSFGMVTSSLQPLMDVLTESEAAKMAFGITVAKTTSFMEKLNMYV